MIKILPVRRLRFLPKPLKRVDLFRRQVLAVLRLEWRGVFKVRHGFGQDDGNAGVTRHPHHTTQVFLKMVDHAVSPLVIAVILLQTALVVEQRVHFRRQRLKCQVVGGITFVGKV